MPLPAVLHDYGLEPQVCCDGFFAPAERMRVAGHLALANCFPPGVCDGADPMFTSYVTHGFDADDPIGDSLAISIGNIRPSPKTTTVGTGVAPIVLARVTYIVRLYETGWPMLERDGDGEILLPDRAAMHEASMHSFSHFERVWRTINDGIARRTLFKGLPIHEIAVGTASPIEPSGGFVGWRMELVLDMGWS